MIFTGDIAIPRIGLVKFSNMDAFPSEKQWIGNLEGSLVKEAYAQSKDVLSKRKVFNSFEAISDLCNTINFKAFNLANNHFLDACESEMTTHGLDAMNIPYVGGGKNLESARKPLLITDEGVDYAVISFGWDAISCIYATNEKEGVNPYTKENVEKVVRESLSAYPDRRVVLFFHWNYELEIIPQPLDREMAHKLIDMGVYAVIGCHAHRVQPIEIYKGHPIVYGLGNFAFPSLVYMGGKHRFPDFSDREICFELKGDGSFLVHEFNYDRESKTVSYVGSSSITPAEFQAMDNSEYIKYFKKHKYKGKGLPVFYFTDNAIIYTMKKRWVKLRDKLIFFLRKCKSITH